MYIPLLNKSDYSLLSSLIKLDDLIKYAKDNNIKSLGLTDNNLYGAQEFIKLCKKNNIKPILGLELVINNKKIYLFCRNYNGYKNLCYINNNEKSTDFINNNSGDLFMVLPYSSISLYDEFKLKDKYIGYSNITEKNEINSNNKIYFNEHLCIEKEDIKYLKYLYLIRDGKTIDENDYVISENCYINSKKINSILDENDFKIYKEIYENTNLEMIKNDLLPRYSNDENFNEKEYLTNLCKKGLIKRFNNKVPIKYANRLMKEISIINEMGFSNYFLVVWDYVKYAKQNNILVGPGRGSAAGSLVSYSLGITEIDPIKYDLFFERFLNPERITMPDIDIDFDALKRDLVIDYVREKYGNKSVAEIITFGTLKSKMVIRDVARIFKSEKNIDAFVKLFDSRFSLEENLKNKNIIDILKKDTFLSQIIDISKKLEELKRHTSVHAAGVVISSENLEKYVPLLENDDGNYVIGYTKDYLEDLGLLKMDFLSIDNLTLISNIVNEAKVDIKNISFDDEGALNIFKNVKTDGVFQFESSGIKNVLRKFPITSFNDLIAILALFRPGPMQFIDSYIKRKLNKEKIDYIDDSIKDILVGTYGIIVYQEQVMQIANVMAGYTLGEADVLRKLMSKSSLSVNDSERNKFISKSIERGYTKEVASKTYDLIYKFITSFGFNKSHSVGYAYVSYQMAYLKAHYPNYFMKYLLSMVIGNEIKTKEYINEIKQNGFEVLKPDINKSELEYVLENDNIRFPINAIKNVGQISCVEIIKERKNSEYIDFFDFVKRCYGKSINKKVIESLINAGCFDSFNNHKTLINNIDIAINYSELCKNLDSSLIEKPELELFEEYTKDELTNKEFETFGFYFSSHPVQKYRQNEIYITNISNYFNKVITIYLLIDKKREIITKKNEKMAFLTGSDEFSTIELVVFPKIYEKCYFIDRKDIVKVIARVERNNSEYQLIVNDIFKLNGKQ